MAVNLDKFPGVKYDMAMNFVKWITSVDERELAPTGTSTAAWTLIWEICSAEPRGAAAERCRATP